MKNRALTAAKFICATVAVWGCQIPMNYSKLVYRLMIFNMKISISTLLLAAATAGKIYKAVKDTTYFSRLIVLSNALHIIIVKMTILMIYRWDFQAMLTKKNIVILLILTSARFIFLFFFFRFCIMKQKPSSEELTGRNCQFYIIMLTSVSTSI